MDMNSFLPSGARYLHWTGISDWTDSISARTKNYRSMILKIAKGIFQSSLLTAAGYGIYKLSFSEPVYLNNFFKQTEDEIAKNGETAKAPDSAISLIKTLYDEHKKFTQWPKSGQTFLSNHLASDAPMSAAITSYLLSESMSQKDTAVMKQILKTCTQQAPESSKSCLAVLKTLTQSNNQESLDRSMKIVRKCRTKENEFCRQAYERAFQLALQFTSTDHLATLSKKLFMLSNETKTLYRNHIESVIPLFTKQITSSTEGLRACKDADQLNQWNQANWDEKETKIWKACTKHASFIEQSAISLNDPDINTLYITRKINNFEEQIKKAIPKDSSKFVKACSHYKDLSSCTEFTKQLTKHLVNMGEVKGLSELASHFEPLLPNILNRLHEKQKWEQGLDFLDSYLSKKASREVHEQVNHFCDRCLDDISYLNTSTMMRFGQYLDESKIPKLLDKIYNMDSSPSNHIVHVVRTWIEKNKYEPQVYRTIDYFFHRESEWLNGRTFGEIARILATFLLQTKYLETAPFEQLSISTRISPLREFPPSYRYDPALTLENWNKSLHTP